MRHAPFGPPILYRAPPLFLGSGAPPHMCPFCLQIGGEGGPLTLVGEEPVLWVYTLLTRLTIAAVFPSHFQPGVANEFHPTFTVPPSSRRVFSTLPRFPCLSLSPLPWSLHGDPLQRTMQSRRCTDLACASRSPSLPLGPALWLSAMSR
eukprot:GGOE01057159.1.p1 GENE.GGOE01057159.1~~GGOE01057159.1.p1  ORF type:complete len:149 (+),score=10.62 GGOE01057159.1:62-508(+)